jgi:phosphoribosylglycinamide formyltransferase 1
VKRIAIFASGTGTNAAKIIDYFNTTERTMPANVALIVCNKPQAGVLNIAQQNNIPSLLIEKEDFFRGTVYLDALATTKIDFIVLAGFLWKVPAKLIAAYPNKIINIHPALLPKYGGKGMYGNFVHEAVIANKETTSGITIHFVNEHFDEGEHIFTASCPVEATDTAASLAAKIHVLEHTHFARVIEEAIGKLY